MPASLTEYEILAIQKTLRDSNLQLRQTTGIVREFTGAGYYCTFPRPAHFPRPARVVSNSALIGRTSSGVDVGFILFIDDKAVTLEVHTWGDQDVDESTFLNGIIFIDSPTPGSSAD